MVKERNSVYYLVKMCDHYEKDITERHLYFEKLSDNASIPTKGFSSTADNDLYSAYDYVVPAKETGLV